MKVFEVITENSDEDKKVIQTVEYVTSEIDSILDVVDFFTEYCDQYDIDLKGVREVLVISQHLNGDNNDN